MRLPIALLCAAAPVAALVMTSAPPLSPPATAPDAPFVAKRDTVASEAPLARAQTPGRPARRQRRA